MGTRLAIGILLLCSASLTQGSSIFAPSRSLVYDYAAEIRAEALYPSTAASLFALKGLLTIETGADSDKVAVKLSDLSSTLYNGALDPNSNDQPRSDFLPLQDQAGELSKAFTVHYVGGAVAGLSGVDGEAEWSVNMKRSLATLLQLDISQLDNPSFQVKENSLYGACLTEYNVQRDEQDYVVRKFLDHSACAGYPTHSWTNVPPIEPFCPAGQDNIVTSTSQRIYTVRANGAVKLITKLVAAGSINAQPFKARNDLQMIVTNQTLSFKSVSDLTTTPTIPTGQMTDLLFRLPGSDFTQGRAPVKQGTLVARVKRLLAEISDSFDATMDRDPNKLHDERVPQILYFMTILEKKALTDLFNEYVLGTSYQQETQRNLFFELLPQVGTLDSILLIRDLIVDRRVRGDWAEDFLVELPFYVRSPTEELLRQCEVFYNLDKEVGESVRTKAILAFGTLVYQTCKTHCTAETQDKYVRKYLDIFTRTESYKEKMLYLEGLSNMEEGKVFDYLEPVIKSNPDSHLRFLAVWATMNKAAYHPDQVYELYWPILTNRTALLEMRVAALTMLVVSKPTAGRFFSLHWYLASVREPRLRHFYYTTLQSLVNTKDPCYSLMSTNAAQVLRLLPAPSQRHWSTGNYVLDHGNTELGFGGMAQLFLIANEKSELPNVFYLMLGSHARGQRLDQMSVYLKLEGIANAVKERLLRIDPNNVSIPQLADILHKMRAAPSSSEPVHFELLIKKEGRVVICEYLNGTTFHQLADVISKVVTLSFDRNINLQIVNSALLNELTIPTDLGTSALYLLSSTSVGSFRGNKSQVSTSSGFSLRTEAELRLSGNSVGSLMTYNPVIDIWQAVQRSTSLRIIVPLEGDLDVDTADRRVKFSVGKSPVEYAGFVSHVRSVVLVRGTGAAKTLRSHCKSCKPEATVSRGEQYRRKNEFLDLSVHEVGARLHGGLFDCEHHNGFEALNAAVLTQNYQVFPASRPLVIFNHLISCWLMVAAPGSCGTEVKLTNIGKQPTKLEGFFQLTSSGSTNSVNLSLAHKSGTKTLHSWQIDATCRQDNSFYKVVLNVVRNAPTEDMRTLCMTALINFPSYPVDKYLVKASEPITAEATFRWASDTDSLCDSPTANDLPVKLIFVAETTVEQAGIAASAKTWPFNACKAGNNADACHRAAHEMATLRKYSVALNYSSPLEPALFVLGRGEDGQLVASIEVSTVRPVVLVTVGMEHFTFDTGRYWIEPFLVNTHYPAVQQAAIAMGLIQLEGST